MSSHEIKPQKTPRSTIIFKRVAKGSAAIVFGFFIALSPLILSAPGTGIIARQRVFAAEYSPTDISKAYVAGLALSICDEKSDWVDGLNPSEINEGGVFVSGNKVLVGYLLDPSDDGEIVCSANKDTTLLFDALDTKPLDMLKEIGVYKLNNDNTQYEADNKADYGAKIKQWIENKYGFRYSDGQPKASQYIQAKAAFDKRCKDPGSENTNKEGAGPVSVVDRNGKLTEYYYILKIGANDVVEVGYGLDGEAASNQEMNCSNIIKSMNSHAQAYVDAVKTNLDDGDASNDEANSGGASGQNAKSCEEQFGFSSGWIVCAALEIISNGIDVLFNFAESLLNIDAQKIYENKGLKTSWSYFRAIATFMLVAVGLVAIIGQAIGKGN